MYLSTIIGTYILTGDDDDKSIINELRPVMITVARL